MNQKMMIGIVIALLALTTFVSAVPAGPKTLVESNQDRWPVWAALNATAIAGNVTQLTFNGSTVTKTYQGYYGNITGYIVLGDNLNNTLYDWSLAAPQGEIYAVRNTVGTFEGPPAIPDWGSVTCASDTNIQTENTRLNVLNPDIEEDAVNRTFVVGGAPDQLLRYPIGSYPHIGTHPQFWVANQSIGAGSCPQASMYNNSWEPSPYFKEVLLQDASANYIIYTAIIAHTVLPNTDGSEFNGFNGAGVTYDFEMMVGEDGHGLEDGGTATPSTYWFYVEID